MEFDRFGRRLGWQLLARGVKPGWGLVLNPVSVPRYFEFAFAWRHLPTAARSSLDAGSPRLFSLRAAAAHPEMRILMINPDPSDIGLSHRFVDALGMANVETRPWAVDAASLEGRRFHCIWSISVVEHIAGRYDDRDAMRMMYDRLEPGGRLIVTVPVDREPWDEYRERDHYGLQSRSSSGKFFFQRFYDEAAIRERLLAPLGREPTEIRWLGERERGLFSDYVERSLCLGIECTIEDPVQMVDNYRLYESWRELPGMGICGLVVDKL
jgi:SAM-dependent methyltransferase